MSVVKVIGTGEAFSSDLGNTSYLLETVGKSILFDCGYQVPERLWRTNSHKDLDAIVLTHLHADHAFGVIPLLARFWEEGRRRPLTIVGHIGTQSSINHLFDLGYPALRNKLKFKIRFIELNPKKSQTLFGMKVSCAPTVHSVLNLCIRIDFRDGRSLAISGDGRHTVQSTQLVDDVNLLLQEVYTLKSEVSGHADLESLIAMIEKSTISKVGIAHHSRKDLAKIHRAVRQRGLNYSRILILKLGMTLRV